MVKDHGDDIKGNPLPPLHGRPLPNREEGGGKLFMCPYPLKVQAPPPRDQKSDVWSRGRPF